MGEVWEAGLNMNDKEIPKDAKKCAEGLVISGILGNNVGADITAHVIISTVVPCNCCNPGNINN